MVRRVALVVLLTLLGAPAPAPVFAAPFDLVVAGGRVIDPASGLDSIRHLGLRDGRIEVISETPIEAAETIDARGLVVAPGFIDLHTHSPNPLGQRYQLLDGVTTALELEAGAAPVSDFGQALAGQARIHFGASVGYGSIRLETMLGVRQAHLLSGNRQLIGWRGYWTALRSLFSPPQDVFVRRATAGERARMRSLLLAGLDAGGLGIGLPLDYFSEAVDGAELAMIFGVAGERQVPLFIHLRRGVNGDPAGLREALALAEKTRAPLHICHIQHNAMRNIELFLAEIRAARDRGVDVTTETLPYNAGSALISSAVFGRDWQTIFGIDYGDVELAATGERFDRERWERTREASPGAQVIHHYVREEWTQRAVREPGVIVVSDLLPMVDEKKKVAPHNGAFSKVLGRYVRETPLLSLADGLSRMTSLPAQRLAKAFPQFARKGRIQVGADADLTLFDLDTIRDRATYAAPYQGSAGIVHVLVAGQWVLRGGQVREDVYPGQNLSVPSAAALAPASRAPRNSFQDRP